MRAYAIHRPLGLGTWPSQHRDKLVEMVNWDVLHWVPEIGRQAFGYLEFSEDIPKEDLDRYELVVPRKANEALERIVDILVRYASDGERFERTWKKAVSLGFDEREMAVAFDRRMAV